MANRSSAQAKPSVTNPAIPPAPPDINGQGAGGADQPKPTPAPDKQWACKIQPRAEGEITVGTKLVMLCEGEPATLVKESLRIENREDMKYALRLLEVKSLDETKAELVVTSWMAGEIEVPNSVLTDGKLRVGIGDQKLTVATVIDPQSNPEGKPFGPFAPFALPWPIWLWLVVALIAALISLALWIPVRRSMKRKKLLTMLEKNAIALSPFNHFNKELRRLTRLVPTSASQPWHEGDARTFFRELDAAFRWFLARELVISAVEGSPSKILAEVKRANPDVHSMNRKDLRLVLDELEKTQNGRPAIEDATQLAELCRTLSDRIAKSKEGRR
ncbi:MAG: hypothetical protein V4760_07425 [Bdellovibrionota bacterium]